MGLQGEHPCCHLGWAGGGLAVGGGRRAGLAPGTANFLTPGGRGAEWQVPISPPAGDELIHPVLFSQPRGQRRQARASLGRPDQGLDDTSGSGDTLTALSARVRERCFHRHGSPAGGTSGTPPVRSPGDGAQASPPGAPRPLSSGFGGAWPPQMPHSHSQERACTSQPQELRTHGHAAGGGDAGSGCHHQAVTARGVEAGQQGCTPPFLAAVLGKPLDFGTSVPSSVKRDELKFRCCRDQTTRWLGGHLAGCPRRREVVATS